MSEEEKKIIVDEDWKTQVEAEREALKAEASGEPVADPAEKGTPPPEKMPPASLEMLVTSLATEAMLALGAVPNPATGEVSTNPEQARYAIDMLEMLQQKTKGNLNPGEEAMFRDVLHQLRMLFVSVQA